METLLEHSSAWESPRCHPARSWETGLGLGICRGCGQVSVHIKCSLLSLWKILYIHRCSLIGHRLWSAYPTMQSTFFLRNRTTIYRWEPLPLGIKRHFPDAFGNIFLPVRCKAEFCWGLPGRHGEACPGPLLFSPLFPSALSFLLPLWNEMTEMANNGPWTAYHQTVMWENENTLICLSDCHFWLPAVCSLA